MCAARSEHHVAAHAAAEEADLLRLELADQRVELVQDVPIADPAAVDEAEDAGVLDRRATASGPPRRRCRPCGSARRRRPPSGRRSAPGRPAADRPRRTARRSSARSIRRRPTGRSSAAPSNPRARATHRPAETTSGCGSGCGDRPAPGGSPAERPRCRTRRRVTSGSRQIGSGGGARRQQPCSAGSAVPRHQPHAATP